jgi:hypothetical protein
MSTWPQSNPHIRPRPFLEKTIPGVEVFGQPARLGVGLHLISQTDGHPSALF